MPTTNDPRKKALSEEEELNRLSGFYRDRLDTVRRLQNLHQDGYQLSAHLLWIGAAEHCSLLLETQPQLADPALVAQTWSHQVISSFLDTLAGSLQARIRLIELRLRGEPSESGEPISFHTPPVRPDNAGFAHYKRNLPTHEQNRLVDRSRVPGAHPATDEGKKENDAPLEPPASYFATDEVWVGQLGGPGPVRI